MPAKSSAELRELLADDRVVGLTPRKQAVVDTFCALVAPKVAAYSAAEPDDVEVVGAVRQMRYLRAFGYDVEQAAEKYVATLQWRLDGQVALVRHQAVEPGYVLPHWDIVSRYWQIRPLFCYDATGSPVMVEGIGRSNLKALLLESGLERAQLLHFWTHMMEWQILLLDRLSTLRGEIVRKAEIRDLDGLGMAHTFGPGIDFFKACAAVTSRHYVEIVRIVIIVNAPWVFDSVYKLLSGAVPEATKAKIKILSASSKAAPATLDEHIGLHKLPRTYGGSNGDDDVTWRTSAPCDLLGGFDGRLESLLPPGARRTPASAPTSRQASAAVHAPNVGRAASTPVHPTPVHPTLVLHGRSASAQPAAAVGGSEPPTQLASWLRGPLPPTRESSRTPLAPEASDARAATAAGAGGALVGAHGAHGRDVTLVTVHGGHSGAGDAAPRLNGVARAAAHAKQAGAGASNIVTAELAQPVTDRVPLRDREQLAPRARSSSVDEQPLQPSRSHGARVCCCFPWRKRYVTDPKLASRTPRSASIAARARARDALSPVPEQRAANGGGHSWLGASSAGASRLGCTRV